MDPQQKFPPTGHEPKLTEVRIERRREDVQLDKLKARLLQLTRQVKERQPANTAA